MSVNGVTGSTQTYTNYSTASAQDTKAAGQTEKKTSQESTSGVVYEKSDAKTSAAAAKKNSAIVAQMKADTDARTNQMRQLVQQLMTKQGQTYGKANDMWRFLAGGNFTVDAATKAQAQADIADDGYWGVNQTSDRIIDFAKALAGDDPAKMEKMVEAFKKGYDMAAKKWGGNLPDISQRTYDAVMEKFNQIRNGSAVED